MCVCVRACVCVCVCVLQIARELPISKECSAFVEVKGKFTCDLEKLDALLAGEG